MQKEIFFGNERAFLASINDYDKILDIFNSRSEIRDVVKTEEYVTYHKNMLYDVLTSTTNDKFIILVEDYTTKTLLNYRIVYFPINSRFSFTLFGSTKKSNTMFGEHIGLNASSTFMNEMMEERKVFDNFVSIQVNYFLPLVNTLRNLSKLENTESRYVYQLHSVVMPGQIEKSAIEKVLIKDELIKYNQPMAILHTSLKPEYRIGHYKDQFKVSEKLLVKYLKGQ